MFASSEAGSYSRLVDFVYHPTLGWRAMKKKQKDLVSRRLSSLSHSGVRLSIDACWLREGCVPPAPPFDPPCETWPFDRSDFDQSAPPEGVECVWGGGVCVRVRVLCVCGGGVCPPGGVECVWELESVPCVWGGGVWVRVECVWEVESVWVECVWGVGVGVGVQCVWEVGCVWWAKAEVDGRSVWSLRTWKGGGI